MKEKEDALKQREQEQNTEQGKRQQESENQKYLELQKKFEQLQKEMNEQEKGRRNSRLNIRRGNESEDTQIPSTTGMQSTENEDVKRNSIASESTFTTPRSNRDMQQLIMEKQEEKERKLKERLAKQADLSIERHKRDGTTPNEKMKKFNIAEGVDRDAYFRFETTYQQNKNFFYPRLHKATRGLENIFTKEMVVNEEGRPNCEFPITIQENENYFEHEEWDYDKPEQTTQHLLKIDWYKSSFVNGKFQKSLTQNITLTDEFDEDLYVNVSIPDKNLMNFAAADKQLLVYFPANGSHTLHNDHGKNTAAVEKLHKNCFIANISWSKGKKNPVPSSYGKRPNNELLMQIIFELEETFPIKNRKYVMSHSAGTCGLVDLLMQRPKFTNTWLCSAGYFCQKPGKKSTDEAEPIDRFRLQRLDLKMNQNKHMQFHLYFGTNDNFQSWSACFGMILRANLNKYTAVYQLECNHENTIHHLTKNGGRMYNIIMNRGRD